MSKFDSRDVLIFTEDAPVPYEGFYTLVMIHEPTGTTVKHMAAVPWVTFWMFENMVARLEEQVDDLCRTNESEVVLL